MLKSRYSYLVKAKGRLERTETRLNSIQEELKEAGLKDEFYKLDFDK